MAIGTVKFFNADKGFGFVAPEGGGKDVFVHVSILSRVGLDTLADGQRVVMDIDALNRDPSNLAKSLRLS